jgi:hypothetical protein
MSGRHLDGTENAELREKIEEAKRRLPLPDLMTREGLGGHAKKSARCPFHLDERPSFSVFQGKNGKGWQWKCYAGCGNGDEIDFLAKHSSLSRREAIKRYLDMAGFPSRAPGKSHEYPESPKCPPSPETRKCHDSPKSPVYPMSNGQELEKALKASAASNACRQRGSEKKTLWQLARDLKAIQKKAGRKLTNREQMLMFNEWHRLSEPFLDSRPTREDYLAAFLAKPAKVRIPTGEGDTLNKALAAVSKLSASELPVIPGVPNAPENLRRGAALHRELSRLCGGNSYFLSCRDTAKAFPGLKHQKADNINRALAQLGVIEIVRVGDAQPGGKASFYGYLLPQSASGESKIAA